MSSLWNVTYLALGQLGLDGRPGLTLSSIAEEIHDDRALANGFIDLKEILAGNPAILYRVLP